MGSQGMPRRYHLYDPKFQVYHMTSTVGSWLIALGFLTAIWALVRAVKNGKVAPANPWGGTTLEWTIQSPPIHENFETTPTVTGRPYEYR